MNRRIKETPADYEVVFEVYDRIARKQRKKSHVYTFKGDLSVESLPAEILSAIQQAKQAVDQHKNRKNAP